MKPAVGSHRGRQRAATAASSIAAFRLLHETLTNRLAADRAKDSVVRLIGHCAAEISISRASACRGLRAAVRQAHQQLEQARSELNADTRDLLNELRRQYRRATRGQNRIDAYQAAEDYAVALVTATRQSVLGGERINLDVLDAEHQLYSTRLDLLQARHDALHAWLQLRYLSGQLHHEELTQLTAAAAQ